MPSPLSRSQLRAEGLSDDQIDRRLRSGRLTAVRRGVLITGAADMTADLLAAAYLHRSRAPVASHLTAARLLGLPHPLAGWRVPEFTCPDGPTRCGKDVRLAVAALAAEDVVRLGGLRITSAARTVVDCARMLPPRDGLAVADAALHLGLTTPAELAVVLGRQIGWPGVKRARAVLALADARRESPLESWSAWTFAELGLSAPVWQVDLLGSDGRFAGRCDAWWHGLAGEADGRSKYRLAAEEAGGADADRLAAVLDDERSRERRIRDLGARLVRWDATDVLAPRRFPVLAARISTELRLSALAASDGQPFRGRTRLQPLAFARANRGPALPNHPISDTRPR